MSSIELVVVMTTVDSLATAQSLADNIVNQHLAACVQIEGPINSVYRWKGQIQSEQEWRLSIKTVSASVEALSSFISDNHPYEIPEILFFTASGGAQPYLDWALEQSLP